MKRINKKSAIAILTACLVFILVLTVTLTSVTLKNNGGGSIEGGGLAETATITDAAKSTDALADGEVPAGYSAVGTPITTGAQFLQYFQTDSQSGTYVLANDIEVNYAPPKDTTNGTNRLRDGVTLDGQGHTIKLTYTATTRTGIGYQTNDEISGNMGYLFDYVSGTIKNLKVTFNGQTINNQFNNATHWCGIAIGVICAKLYASGTIENSSVTLNANMTFYNQVSAGWTNTAWTDMFFGAFAGFAEGTIKSCTTIVDNSTYVNVYAGAGSRSSTKARFGGLVGWTRSTMSMVNCSFRNTRTNENAYLKNDGTNKAVGFAAGSAERGGSIDGFIYQSNNDNVSVGIINNDKCGLVTGIGKPAAMKNIYANRQISGYWLVGDSANQGCVNKLKAGDADKLEMYFDKSYNVNIVFKLKDSYASDGIIWSITHGKGGSPLADTLKDVSGSVSRCVSIARYDGAEGRDAGSDVTIEYGTYTTLNLADTAVTYSNSDIDVRTNASVTLANGAAKNTGAFEIMYNNAAALPRNAGAYTMTAAVKVAGTSIVYYDTAAKVAAKIGTQGTLTVNRYNLTMSAGGGYYTVSDKIYDGSYDHTAGVAGSIQGVNGEVVEFVIDEAYFIKDGNWSGDPHTIATANVADATRLRIEHHMLSPNYTVNGLADDLTLPRSIKWTETGVSITPMNVTVDGSYFAVEDKTYDGTDTAAVTETGTVNGIAGTTLMLSDLTARFNSKDVVSANKVIIGFKNSDTNYTINNVAANTAVSIETAKTIAPKRLTVTFGDNLVQSYRGKSAIDPVVCTITDGLLAGETANVTGTVIGGVNFTRFGRYTFNASVDNANYYASETAELIMVYFKPSKTVGKWLIESYGDLEMINDNEYYLALDYEQTGDIDARYAAAVNVNGEFAGSYDGGGFTIKNLVLFADSLIYGLFERVSGSISNLTVADASINSYIAGATIGGIAGEVTSGGTLTKTAYIGDIYANGTGGSVGGIAGANGGTINGGAAIGEIIVTGSRFSAGGIVGRNTGSVSNVIAFMIVDTAGSSNEAGVIAGVNSGTARGAATLGFAVKNGVKSGSGSSVNDMLGLSYNGATILSLLNTYRNKLGIDITAGEVEIANVNDLSLMREYRYLSFKQTADITLHIDSAFIELPTIVGSFNANGFKVYSTDGITKTELRIA